MTRRLLVATFVLAMIGATAPTGVAVGSDDASPESTYQESFEKGFGGWTPATDGLARDWEITRIPGDRRVHSCADGSWCLSYYLDGRNDDGTIWVERQFTVPPSAKLRLEMTFWLLNEFESGANMWPIVAYFGRTPPAVESDFTIVGRTEERVGWTRHVHGQSVNSSETGTVWIAFGIGATWETERTYLLDFVEVEVTTVS